MFNPQSGGDPGFARPTQQAPSALTGLSAVVDAFTGMRRQQQAGAGSAASVSERKDARQQARIIGLQDGMKKVEAIRQQKGEAAAKQAERTILMNYILDDGDPDDPAAQAALELTLGVPAEFVGRDPEEVAINAARTSEEYGAGIMASFSLAKDATPEQRDRMALQIISEQAAIKAAISSEDFNWVRDNGEEKVTSLLRTFQQTTLGGLNMIAQEGGMITREQLVAARGQWLGMKGEITGILPNEEALRRRVEQRMDSIDQTFEFLEEVSISAGSTGIEAALISNFGEGILAGLQSGDVNSLEGLFLLQVIKEDPAAIRHFGEIEATSIADALKFLSTFFAEKNGLVDVTPTEGGSTVGGSPDATPSPTTSYRGVDVEEKLQVSKMLIDSIPTLDVSQAPSRQKAIAQNLEAAFAAMESIGADDDRFTSLYYAKQVFNGDIIKHLRSIEGTEGRELANSAFRAVDVQYAVSVRGLQERLRGTGVEWSAEAGFTWDRDILAARTNQDPRTILLLEEMADEHYGGDLLSMIEDRGRRLRSIGGDAAQRASMIANSLANVEGDVRRAKKQLEIVNFFDQKRKEFRALSQSKAEAATDEDGNPALVIEDIENVSSQNAPMRLMSLMDKHEGGGNYDTLYKHSQREGKDFGGTRVSQMTLGELSNFSKGAYANWSKRELGYVATPMGRYQIVGTTLRRVQKAMGLSDDTVFTPAVQDAMFHYLANEALEGKQTPAAKRKAMRAVWEGFKHVSDTQLDVAIAEFEGSPTPDLDNIETRDSVFAEGSLPNEKAGRTEGVTAPEVTAEGAVISGDSGVTQVGDAVVQQGGGERVASNDQRGNAQAAVNSQIWQTLAQETKDMLTRILGSEEEAAKRVLEMQGKS